LLLRQKSQQMVQSSSRRAAQGALPACLNQLVNQTLQQQNLHLGLAPVRF
jgi:hypothetical protein